MNRDLSAPFEPFSLKTLRLPNRIVMAPMGRNFAQGGVVGPAYRDYFRRRAVGGVRWACALELDRRRGFQPVGLE